MAMKNYSIRLDEEEYEKLREVLSEYGDPDLNIGYVIRSYIRDLNRALPDLKKSDIGIRNNLAFWGSMMRHMVNLSRVENILKGVLHVESESQGKGHERKK